MSIAWISPLDVDATEIARYSAQLMPFLQRYVHIAAVSGGDGAHHPAWWTPQDGKTNEERGLAPLPIYHIGNNALHLPVHQQAMREPGLVVLHDTSLVDLARYISREAGTPELWKAQMREQYGDEVSALVNRSESSPACHNDMAAHYPLFQPFVKNALGVVVHSRFARESLLKTLPEGTPVKQLDLPAPPPPPVPDRDYSCDVLKFVFCGHVGPNRRLVEFFEAWGSLDDPARISLEIFGKIRNSRKITSYAQHFGVASHLHLRGFVQDSALEKALQCAHFALNLRWPTMGEASASQLRYWSAGLPTLVTDVGWYAELPDDAVCKIPIDREVEEIGALLKNIVIAPQDYQAVGQRGWEYLSQRHSADNYAKEMASFAQQLRERRLVFMALDQELVKMIASMCESGTDIGLFRDALEVAVGTLAPGAD